MENPQMFEGWAVVELLGHGRELGWVTTQYFGNQAMFLIASPEIVQREVTLVEGGCFRTATEHRWLPAGSKVVKAGIPDKTRLVSSAAIFAINPSTEDAVKGELGGNGPILFLISEPEVDPEKLPF